MHHGISHMVGYPRPPLDIRPGIYPSSGHQTWAPTPSHFPPLATDIWQSSMETCSNFFTWGPTSPPPPVLTTSFGHRAGGTHPTGMLSYFKAENRGFGFFRIMKTNNFNSFIFQMRERKLQTQVSVQGFPMGEIFGTVFRQQKIMTMCLAVVS